MKRGKRLKKQCSWCGSIVHFETTRHDAEVKRQTIKELIKDNDKYIQMLINAMNDRKENEALHMALAEQRATELRVRYELKDNLKERLKAIK